MSIVIRKAEIGDRGSLMSLICALADYEALEQPTSEAQDRLAEHAWGEKPRYEAWIAEVDAEAVGYCIVFETYSTFLAKPTLYLEDLFILPEYRKLGIGSQVFHMLAIEALNRGCGRIEWACLDWNEVGLSFYAKLGASRLQDWVSFRLDEANIRVISEKP